MHPLHFDLTENNAVVLNGLNPADYNIAYYPTVDDADNETNALPLLYTNVVPSLQTIYIRLENNLLIIDGNDARCSVEHRPVDPAR